MECIRALQHGSLYECLPLAVHDLTKKFMQMLRRDVRDVKKKFLEMV